MSNAAVDSAPLADVPLVHRRLDVGELTLHAVEAGQGPLAILLHGFPEHWYSWRHQIPVLVAEGFKVVAPDMRGYNLSDKPDGIAAYRVDRLARDVAGIVEACGAERATVIAHDWGAGAAWGFAMRYPELLERMVILNGPHPLSFMRALRTPEQVKKSWYMLWFQLPWMPERLIRRHDYEMIRKLFRYHPTTRGAFSENDIEQYVRALDQPGALTAAINYYRAMRFELTPSRARRMFVPVEAPVRVIWGDRDRHLGLDTALPVEREWVPRGELVHVPDASHWIQVDKPAEVNAAIVEFLRATAG